MEASVALDPNSGNILIGAFTVTRCLKPSELPETFSLGPERTVHVVRKSAACQFAVAQTTYHGKVVRVELRFEDKVLVSCFLSFPGLAPEEERRSCTEWLVRQIGFGGALARFPWGGAGIATDRSGNSHVFIHNANNSWAH
ncbi:hypothetical protein [Lysobacter sp. HA18]